MYRHEGQYWHELQLQEGNFFHSGSIMQGSGSRTGLQDSVPSLITNTACLRESDQFLCASFCLLWLLETALGKPMMLKGKEQPQEKQIMTCGSLKNCNFLLNKDAYQRRGGKAPVWFGRVCPWPQRRQCDSSCPAKLASLRKQSLYFWVGLLQWPESRILNPRPDTKPCWNQENCTLFDQELWTNPVDRECTYISQVLSFRGWSHFHISYEFLRPPNPRYDVCMNEKGVTSKRENQLRGMTNAARSAKG